jgi:hypothetical protein
MRSKGYFLFLLALLYMAMGSLAFEVGNWGLVKSYGLRRAITMKGKGNRIPIDRRGGFVNQQKQAAELSRLGNNKPQGVPVFKVYVRPRDGGLWIPCGDLVGDKRATALVNAWLSGFLEDMYKSQLDKGVARSIFQQEEKFVSQITANFRPFKSFTKAQLQFGYKIEFPGVEEKKGEQGVTVLEKGMDKTWLDVARESFSRLLKSQS